MAHSKDIAQLLDRVRRIGWTVKFLGSGHYRVQATGETKALVFLSTNAGDARSYKNTKQRLKRAGFFAAEARYYGRPAADDDDDELDVAPALAAPVTEGVEADAVPAGVTAAPFILPVPLKPAPTAPAARGAEGASMARAPTPTPTINLPPPPPPPPPPIQQLSDAPSPRGTDALMVGLVRLGRTVAKLDLDEKTHGIVLAVLAEAERLGLSLSDVRSVLEVGDDP